MEVAGVLFSKAAALYRYARAESWKERRKDVKEEGLFPVALRRLRHRLQRQLQMEGGNE